MKQTLRNNVFETNSSSIHCLTVDKNIEPAKDLHELNMNIYPYNYDEICKPEEFATFIGKLRYLWTLICNIDNYGGYEERVDELKSMLRSIFPLVVFCDIENIAYLEDFEDIFESNLIYDETFIRKWLTDGTGYYLDRDYSWEDHAYEMYLNKVCSYINNDYTIWSEG